MKRAFTFFEVLAVMMIIGMLFVLTVASVTKITTDNKMARFKKGYATFENAIATLLHNKSIYGSRRGFKDTSKAELFMSKNVNGEMVEIPTGEVIGKTSIKKFREGFKYTVDVVKDNIKCDVYPGNSADYCFMTDDGVVYGIPNTDFVEVNMIKIKDSDGDKVSVLPVTMYVDYDGSKKDPNKDAFIIGVQYDGNIHFVPYDECKNGSKATRCKLDYYIKSKTVSKQEEG